MNFSMVIYSHSDYSDLWNMLFTQNKKYLNNINTYFIINRDNNSMINIPPEYNQIYYDSSLKYTNRLFNSISNINDDIFLFLHEDMILYNKPNIDLLNMYSNYISDGLADSIKLIYCGEYFTISDFDETLVSNDFSKFSIQPTLIRKNYMIDILKNNINTNIWDLERNVINGNKDFMVKLGMEPKRGIYHYDSYIFPYIATAIVKGKWNYSEYNRELNFLFEEYNIDKNIRGFV